MEGEEAWRERYSRQLALTALGEGGQRELADSSVVVVGAGGLGTNSVELLARMGVGLVRVVDADAVEMSNLHRVRVFGVEHLGRPKVEVLAQEVGSLVGGAVVEPVHAWLSPSNALGLLEGADVVLDGLDNMPSRYLLNDACLELGVPWIYGGVVATGGLVAPFLPGGPCLRCLFPEPPGPGTLPTTETHGIHPSLPSVVASVQVAQATRVLLGERPEPRLLAMELWTDDWRTVTMARREGCPSCGLGRRDFLEGG